jgi:hypothetical protein
LLKRPDTRRRPHADWVMCEVHIGPGTRLRVVVKQPEATHEIQFGKLREWLEGGARSPNEQVTKARLRKVLSS